MGPPSTPAIHRGPNTANRVVATQNYEAVKEDEICVNQGDVLEVIATNAQGEHNYTLVHVSSSRKHNTRVSVIF